MVCQSRINKSRITHPFRSLHILLAMCCLDHLLEAQLKKWSSFNPAKHLHPPKHYQEISCLGIHTLTLSGMIECEQIHLKKIHSSIFKRQLFWFYDFSRSCSVVPLFMWHPGHICPSLPGMVTVCIFLHSTLSTLTPRQQHNLFRSIKQQTFSCNLPECDIYWPVIGQLQAPTKILNLSTRS